MANVRLAVRAEPLPERAKHVVFGWQGFSDGGSTPPASTSIARRCPNPEGTPDAVVFALRLQIFPLDETEVVRAFLRENIPSVFNRIDACTDE